MVDLSRLARHLSEEEHLDTAFTKSKVTGQLEFRADQRSTSLQKRNATNMTGQLEMSTNVRSHSL
jgi:hypothetical protein